MRPFGSLVVGTNGVDCGGKTRVCVHRKTALHGLMLLARRCATFQIGVTCWSMTRALLSNQPSFLSDGSLISDRKSWWNKRRDELVDSRLEESEWVAARWVFPSLRFESCMILDKHVKPVQWPLGPPFEPVHDL